jgi:hypothetical protein
MCNQIFLTNVLRLMDERSMTKDRLTDLTSTSTPPQPKLLQSN